MVGRAPLYGDVALANKTTGHEMKALQALLTVSSPLVVGPLAAVVDVLGFRLMAQAMCVRASVRASVHVCVRACVRACF